MTQSEIAELLKAIEDLYPHARFPRAGIALKAWHYALKDKDTDLVEKAFFEVLKNTCYPPKIAEICKQYDILTANSSKCKTQLNALITEVLNDYPQKYRDEAATRKIIDKTLKDLKFRAQFRCLKRLDNQIYEISKKYYAGEIKGLSMLSQLVKDILEKEVQYEHFS